MGLLIAMSIISFFIGFFSCAILSVNKENDAYKKGKKDGKNEIK